MTVREALKYTEEGLKKNGIDSPEYEARVIMEDIFGYDRLRLVECGSHFFDGKPRLDEIIQKRSSGMPLQYIIGRWSFMDRDFFVGEGVLIPRDDTEVCVRECLSAVKGRSCPRIIDLCSGSGIIALTLSRLIPDSAVTAVELEDKAFEYLGRNIEFHGAKNVTAVKDDIFLCHKAFADGYFDILVSNPPYIKTEEISSLQREVGFEPKSALDGGQDGLDFYRCIASEWLPKLKDGGFVSLEIGETQASEVCGLLKDSGIVNLNVKKDIQGLDRTITGTKNGT